MFFTREDIEKIHQGLLRLGIKDSELPETINVNSDDTLAVVQDGKNKKINIEEFFNNISLFKKEGFINITYRFNKHSISLIEAIQIVPTHQIIDGLVITFEDINGDWRIYQFRGDAVDFFDENKWTDLYDYTNYIVKSITPDEEDLTVSKPNKNGNAIVSLKDRVYDESNFSGKGYKILRKNIQTIDGVRKNILTQNMINKPNTIYEIRYDFELNGETITIADNCVLYFTSGKIYNGNIIMNNAIVYTLCKESLLKENTDRNYYNIQDNIDKLNDTVYPIILNFNINADIIAMSTSIHYSISSDGKPLIPSTMKISKQVNDNMDTILLNIPATSGSLTTNIEGNREIFKFEVTKTGRTNKSTSTTRYLCYYGGNPVATMNAEILNTLNKVSATEVSFNPKVTTKDNDYIWLVVPSYLSISHVTSSGFDVTLDTPQTITNTLGSFKAYRTANPLTPATWNLVIS